MPSLAAPGPPPIPSTARADSEVPSRVQRPREVECPQHHHWICCGSSRFPRCRVRSSGDRPRPSPLGSHVRAGPRGPEPDQRGAFWSVLPRHRPACETSTRGWDTEQALWRPSSPKSRSEPAGAPGAEDRGERMARPARVSPQACWATPLSARFGPVELASASFPLGLATRCEGFPFGQPSAATHAPDDHGGRFPNSTGRGYSSTTAK